MTSPIGCASWTCAIVGRGGSPIKFETAFSSISRTHPINQSGSASITIPVSASSGSTCCEVLEGSEPWRDEVLLYRDRSLVFAGPLKSITASQSGGQAQAPDLFHWLEQRFLRDFHGDGDVSDVFRALFDMAMEDDTSPNIDITTRQTGIQTTQDYKEEQFHRAADAMRTLASIGIDFTMVGRTLLAGGKEVFLADTPLLLHDEGVLSAELSKEGENLMTDAAVVGSPTRVGGTAPTGRAVTGVELYGLIQRSFSELLIKDNIAADASAAGHLEAGQPAPRRLKVVLSDKCAFEYEDVIPGRRVDVRLSESAGCARVVDTMRLVKVDTNVSAGEGGDTEQVTLDLLPLGVTD